MFAIHPSLKKHLLACVAAGGFCLISTETFAAGNCGCEVSCHSCPPVSHGGCTCQCRCSRGPGAFSKAFDSMKGSMKGGVEKLMSFAKCDSGCDDAGCDDACDAAMIDELMLPVPSQMHHHNDHIYHGHSPSPPPTHQPYDGPTEDVRITPTGPSQWQTAPRPRIESEHGQHLGSGARLPEPVDVVPPPVRIMSPENGPNMRLIPESRPEAGDNDDGGLFDTLSDPFSDDEARAKTYRAIRPTSYEQPINGNRVTGMPLSRSNQTSSRRVVKSVR